jgi:hypothetical protein
LLLTGLIRAGVGSEPKLRDDVFAACEPPPSGRVCPDGLESAGDEPEVDVGAMPIAGYKPE